MSDWEIPNGIVIDWINGFLDGMKGVERDQEAEIETATQAEIIEAVSAVTTEEEAYCTCEARVMCHFAFRSSKPVRIINHETSVYINNLEQLNQTDIELAEPFLGCMKAPKEKKFKCIVDKNSIEGGIWQDVNEGYKEGEKGMVSTSSYMICTKYGGMIYIYDNGQEILKYQKEILKDRITFDSFLYSKNTFYRKTADYISEIHKITDQFDDILITIQEVYDEEKKRYEKLAEESKYFPPELIAAIHFQENAKDYIEKTFHSYLHNGDELGKKSDKFPYPALFYEFEDAALDALKGKEDYFIHFAKRLNLTSDSKDLTAMTAFAALYNGWDRKQDGKSPYVYNGTDLYEDGLYTSDFHYDAKATYENCGVYLILMRLLDQSR